jgi:hypothetical protein
VDTAARIWIRGDIVTFADPRTGEAKELAADSYEQVYGFMFRSRTWKLQMGNGPETMPFNGTLGGLREWTCRLGFLRGQGNLRRPNTRSSGLTCGSAAGLTWRWLVWPGAAQDRLSADALVI